MTLLSFIIAALSSASIIGGGIATTEVMFEYQKFLQEFGKDHNHINDDRRIEQFRRFHTLVKEHNAINSGNVIIKPTFVIRINALSDLLPEELEKRFGFRDSPEVPQAAVQSSKHRRLSKQTHRQSSGYRSNYYPFFPWEEKNDDVDFDVSATVDWSSHNNPIGSSVMPAVRNQGSCGACWAFVAVATVEASLRIALSSQSSSSSATHNMEGAELQITRSLTAEETLPISEFNSIPSLTSKPQKIGGDIADSAEASLESTEPSLESSSSSVEMAWIPSLSVQQLVDCDTSFNRGCSGGSPLFAFHYIADNGLVPWSRYEYEEKVDVCGAELTSSAQAPVAKYFIKEYGKLPMLDSAVLQAAVARGPVAVGVCGTDPYFMLYSSGVFDMDTCCVDQNHAITIVGYGHDSSSGLDYWLAQNSWGTRWGENGYIKIKKTDVQGVSGICGMLINPMFASGGYILDEKGNYIDPTRTAHYPVFFTSWEHWLQDNWREVMMISSAVLMVVSLLVLIYACYLERLMYLASQVAAMRGGYATIEETH